MNTVAGGSDAAVDSTALEPDNPWLGLLTFREADERFFFGRKKETEELFRRVMRARLTVLFGLSGLGKSSLLFAGLFPKLRRENLLPVYIRLDHSEQAPDLMAQTYEAIAAAAAAAQMDAPQRQADESLWEFFHRRDTDFWSPRNRVVIPLIVFDQFEEFFTLGGSTPERLAASEAFVDELANLVEGHPPARLKQRLDEHPDEVSVFDFKDHPYKIIFSLREDFLPELEGLRERIGSIAINRLRLRRMRGEAALEVVNQAPHLIEPEVAEQVVRSVSAVEDSSRPLNKLQVEPALLSVVCRELNNKRQQLGDARISMELVEGSHREIVSDLYERSMADLAPEVRLFVEERLLTASGLRDSVAEENALLQPGVTEQDLKRLVDRRLIRIEERGEVDRVELTHDLLTNVIAASRDKRHRREAKEQEARARRAAEARERAVRRKLMQSYIIGAAFLFMALSAAFLARQAMIAEKEALQALARTQVAEGIRLLNTGRSDQALAYLAAALHNDPASTPARSWISDLLLRKRWNLPSSPTLRHMQPVTSAMFNRAGDRLVTASKDGTVRIWNVATGEPLIPPLPHDDWVNSVALSPDETRIATASKDGAARLWDAETGARIGAVMQHDGPVYSVAFSPDQRWLVTASEDGTARLWDAANGDPAHEEPLEHKGPVIMAVFGAGGKVATASLDNTARIWDAVTGKPVGDALSHSGAVNSVAFSPDNHWVATASDDSTARLWNASTGAAVNEILPHAGPVSSVAFAPDGTRLATASAANAVQLWDLQPGDEFGKKLGDPMRHDGPVLSAKFDVGGQRLVTASRDSTARLWDARTGAPLGEPLHHDDAVGVAAFSVDGGQVVTASWDGTVRAWHARTVSSIAEDHPHDRAVNSAIFDAGGQRLLTVPDSSVARLWDVKSGALAGELRHDPKINSATFSPNGNRIVTTSRDKTARVWDADTAEQRMVLEGHDDTVESAAFSPDQASIVTASRDDTARLWDAETGEPFGEAMMHDGTVSAAAFGPDGTKIITVSRDETARVWDARTGRSAGEPMLHEDPVTALAISPDGDSVVTAAGDIAIIWNTDTGERVNSFQHEDNVESVAFSPDGRQVLTASKDRTAKLWDVATGEPVGKPLTHDNWVNMARYSPDGRLIATASRDETARVWDAGTGEPVGAPLKHDGTVNSVAFSPDGRRLVTASRDKMARIWDVMLGSEDDADLLAELAGAVGGKEISPLGTVERMADQYQRLAILKANSADVSADEFSTESFVRWIFDEADSRAISPLSGITVDD